MDVKHVKNQMSCGHITTFTSVLFPFHILSPDHYSGFVFPKTIQPYALKRYNNGFMTRRLPDSHFLLWIQFAMASSNKPAFLHHKCVCVDVYTYSSAYKPIGIQRSRVKCWHRVLLPPKCPSVSFQVPHECDVWRAQPLVQWRWFSDAPQVGHYSVK